MVGIAYEGQRVAQEHKSRGMVGQLVGEALDVGVDIVVCLAYFERLLIDLVWRELASACRSFTLKAVYRKREHHDRIHMTAWGSLARLVPRRNFRSFVLVSSEKV